MSKVKQGHKVQKHIESDRVAGVSLRRYRVSSFKFNIIRYSNI